MNLAGDIGRGVAAAFQQVEQATRGITSGTFTVNKDNVLAAARIIESAAETLQDRNKSILKDLRLRPPGNDDVSIRMAAAWNDVLIDNDDSYELRITDYVAGLRRLAVQLGDTARAYGFSEDEIETAFRTSGA
jgi:hypothetical protein